MTLTDHISAVIPAMPDPEQYEPGTEARRQAARLLRTLQSAWIQAHEMQRKEPNNG